MKLTTLAIAAAFAAGCTVKNNERSSLVASKVIQAVGPTTCLYLPGTPEAVFGTFDPAAGYVHAVVVQNRLPDNSGIGPGRLNTNDFQVEGATITTDVLVGPAQSIATQTVPANGFITSGNTSLPIGLQLAQPGAIQPGSDVRFHIQIFGTLTDGSTLKTNTYEYAAHAITSPVIGSPCTAGAIAIPCETGDPTGKTATQDTGFVCQAPPAP
jgi:hypothetical protein